MSHVSIIAYMHLMLRRSILTKSYFLKLSNNTDKQKEIQMAIKAQSDPLWGQIVNGAKNPEMKSLATRLVVTRLRQSFQNKTMTLGQASAELYRFAAENDFAQRDLNLI